MTMDRLGSLSAFVTSAETRSFTAAGQKLGVSSSAIGKTIARLEERLGVRLFHRSTRSITLTPEGTLFLARCHTIFEEIDAAEVELAQATSAPRGKLRLSMPLTFMLLMPLISEFALAYPDVELDLDFTDRFVDVIDEGFDAVMRTGDVVDSRLMMRVLGNFDYVVAASPAYLARKGTPAVPEDLVAHACIQHRFSSSGKVERWSLGVEGVEVPLELPRGCVANTLVPLIDMAERGLGLIFVPRFTVRAQLGDGRLVTVLDAYSIRSNTFRALWPSGRLTPKVRVFIDFMNQRLFPAEPA